jgi:hypothetical protein
MFPALLQTAKRAPDFAFGKRYYSKRRKNGKPAFLAELFGNQAKVSEPY